MFEQGCPAHNSPPARIRRVFFKRLRKPAVDRMFSSKGDVNTSNVDLANCSLYVHPSYTDTSLNATTWQLRTLHTVPLLSESSSNTANPREGFEEHQILS